jgi:hypothetical protein
MFKQYVGICFIFNPLGTSSAPLRISPEQRNWKDGNSRHDEEMDHFQGKEQVRLLVYKYDSCFNVHSQVLFMDFTILRKTKPGLHHWMGILFKQWLITNFQESIYGEIPKRRPTEVDN